MGSEAASWKLGRLRSRRAFEPMRFQVMSRRRGAGGDRWCCCWDAAPACGVARAAGAEGRMGAQWRNTRRAVYAFAHSVSCFSRAGEIHIMLRGPSSVLAPFVPPTKLSEDPACATPLADQAHTATPGLGPLPPFQLSNVSAALDSAPLISPEGLGEECMSSSCSCQMRRPAASESGDSCLQEALWGD